jgi:hypothetical protein
MTHGDQRPVGAGADPPTPSPLLTRCPSASRSPTKINNIGPMRTSLIKVGRAWPPLGAAVHAAALGWPREQNRPVMRVYGDMKERGVLASANPGRITVRWDVFGIHSQRVL